MRGRQRRLASRAGYPADATLQTATPVFGNPNALRA